MPLTVTVNTVAECFRTDCNILGDNKKIRPTIVTSHPTYDPNHITIYSTSHINPSPSRHYFASSRPTTRISRSNSSSRPWVSVSLTHTKKNTCGNASENTEDNSTKMWTEWLNNYGSTILLHKTKLNKRSIRKLFANRYAMECI